MAPGTLVFFLIRLLLNPGAAHAGVAPFVRRVIFAFCVHVLSTARVVLQRRNGSDRARARRKAINHRHPIFADQPGAHLIPATDRPMAWDACVVSLAERNELFWRSIRR